MHLQPEPSLVSVSSPIGRKQETDGNQTGNVRETKPSFLCRNGNEDNQPIGNDVASFGAVRFQTTPTRSDNAGHFLHSSMLHL